MLLLILFLKNEKKYRSEYPKNFFKKANKILIQAPINQMKRGSKCLIMYIAREITQFCKWRIKFFESPVYTLSTIKA